MTCRVKLFKDGEEVSYTDMEMLCNVVKGEHIIYHHNRTIAWIAEGFRVIMEEEPIYREDWAPIIVEGHKRSVAKYWRKIRMSEPTYFLGTVRLDGEQIVEQVLQLQMNERQDFIDLLKTKICTVCGCDQPPPDKCQCKSVDEERAEAESLQPGELTKDLERPE